MSYPSDINHIVHEILADLSLKEKAAIANMDKDEVPYLQYAFYICVKNQIGEDDEFSKDAMHLFW